MKAFSKVSKLYINKVTKIQVENRQTKCFHYSKLLCFIIDNERNGLETQVKALMLLMLHLCDMA